MIYSKSCGDALRPGPGPLREPGGQAVSQQQEEVVTTWPVPAQAEGRDQGGAVAVTVV